MQQFRATAAGKAPADRWTIGGDPTEAALLVMAAKGGIDITTRNKALPRIGHLPFESVRKRMTCVNRVNGAVVAYVKGAPAETLALCTRVLLNGRVETADRRAAARGPRGERRHGARWAAGARLCTAPPAFSEGFTVDNTEQDLVFLGLAGLMDPPRPEVPKAMELCRRAGIRTIMLTGDYGLTALAIARKIGLVTTAQPRVVTGQRARGDGRDRATRPC